MKNNLCFIICHRYNKNYKSYIKYYIDNIQKFYKDSFILIVDNNSPDLCIVEKLFENYKNIKIITNNSLSKRELGGYNEGIRYIKQNNLLLEYEYFVFSQDSFILKNKFDVEKELSNKNILACSFIKINGKFAESHEMLDPESVEILKKIDCFDKRENFNICWCNSFVLHKSKVMDYYEIVKDKVMTNKAQTCVYERYLSGILYYLNNYNYVSLCGETSSPDQLTMLQELGYDCHNVDIIHDKISCYFAKTIQQRP